MLLPTLAGVALLGVAAEPALACKCSCERGAAELVRDVPVFFRGRPIAVAVDRKTRRYTFEIETVLKGEPVQSDRTVATPLSSASCGVQFDMQRFVLVGAYPGEKGWSTNLCTHYCIGELREEIERLLARCKPGAPCPPEG